MVISRIKHALQIDSKLPAQTSLSILLTDKEKLVILQAIGIIVMQIL